MRKNKYLIFTTLAVIVGILALGFLGVNKNLKNNNRLAKTNNNDDTDFIAINDVLMWIGNNGMGSHNPISNDAGFFWPGGENASKTAIYADGLIWGARVGREIRVGGATYRYGLQAGKILDNGEADDPSLDKYRIYKIRKGWESVSDLELRDRLERDFNEWPVDDGAPWVDVDGDGIYTPGTDSPDFVGDEVLWCVSNDLDAGRTTFLYGTLPMGLEIQTLVFGFSRTGDLGNMVFKKYKIINKGQNKLKDMILGYWSDTDLGDANDDLTGADTVLSLGYTYNGTNTDATYGPNPPSVGYDFFQGPIVPGAPADSAKFLDGWRHGFKNLPMTAFTFYINPDNTYADPDLGVAAGSVQMYNFLDGRNGTGEPFVDPNTSEETVFVLAGDPVAGTGWYEVGGWPGGPAPGDRRHLMASGPFTMAPGDTQEVVVGLVIARGANNLNSITELKRSDKAAQIAYDLDFNITASPPAPIVHHFSQDKKITLWWESNAESYDEPDPLIFGLGLDDTTYTFEGYRLWQFPTLTSSIDDAVQLDIFDIENGINKITSKVIINGVEVEITLFESRDDGLTQYFVIDEDKVNNLSLINGKPYFFAVTAYAYSEHSIPEILESTPVVMQLFPRRPNIDESYSTEPLENNSAEKIAGISDSKVKYVVVDPLSLENDKYKVEIGESGNNLNWSLLRTTVSDQDPSVEPDTLLADQTIFADDANFDSTKVPVLDGFYVKVYNDGLTALNGEKSRLKEAQEIVNGQVSTENIFNADNSTGKWRVLSSGTIPPPSDLNDTEDLNSLNLYDNLGIQNYEIRFTDTGSEYYLTTLKSTAFNGVGLKDDSLGLGTVPFEIWDLGDDLESAADDIRLLIKIQDDDKDKIQNETWPTKDGKWTQRANGQWEPIFAMKLDPYPSPFPPTVAKINKKDQLIGNIVIAGELPVSGTTIRFTTWKPMKSGDAFTFSTETSNTKNTEVAKSRLDNITVYPNPYYAAQGLEQSKYNRFVRFLGLPTDCTIRIFTISGVFIRKLEKSSASDFLDWDLLNKDSLPIASGIYLAHIEMPGIGEKILKIAVIVETQIIDRI